MKLIDVASGCLCEQSEWYMAIDISTDFQTIYFENLMATKNTTLWCLKTGNVDLLFSIIKLTNNEILRDPYSEIQRQSQFGPPQKREFPTEIYAKAIECWHMCHVFRNIWCIRMNKVPNIGKKSVDLYDHRPHSNDVPHHMYQALNTQRKSLEKSNRGEVESYNNWRWFS